MGRRGRPGAWGAVVVVAMLVSACAAVPHAPSVRPGGALSRPRATAGAPQGRLVAVPTARGLYVPVVSRVPTRRRVVFIGIDDGWYRDPGFVTLIQRTHVPVTVFLLNDAARLDYGYFRRLQAAGADIEDHTLTHPVMTRLGLTAQRRQICQTADIYQRVFGVRPTLFRPPYGEANLLTRRAARLCGMHALVLWQEVSGHGQVRYKAGPGFRPGDILLIHFRPGLAHDFAEVLRTIAAQGFTVARLTDYL